MNRKTYWKVIRGNRWSAIVESDVAVCYPVNKWAKPLVKDSKLLVFSTKSLAENWRNLQLNGLMVVPCHIKRSRVKRRNILTPADYTPSELVDFWRKRKTTGQWTKPKGTVFANEVFCLE